MCVHARQSLGECVCVCMHVRVLYVCHVRVLVNVEDLGYHAKF